MTAFVRLSNKKHLLHASRHAELHFSDGLCIMAHSPKAFLLTFHLLVRKSHYQHKMNFLKLEAYPLLARIRQLLPVLGQCLMYFIAAVFLLVASNAALTGSLHGLLGKASHTALGAVPLAAFLCSIEITTAIWPLALFFGLSSASLRLQLPFSKQSLSQPLTLLRTMSGP